MVKKTEQNSTLDDLNIRIEKMEAKLKALNVLANKINADITKLDTNAYSQLSKRYGFDGDRAYYIGAASGRLYTTHITKKVAEMIGNVRNLTSDEIHELNLIFLKK